ncbi:MAG: hypothetical protein VX625_02250, partial [Candidatus Thermoplasmatota archaeon]|nr:hypothetical protein [Candidatus Thermoplasmatota archaeon]
MFSKRIISMLVVLSFISQALVVVDTDSYSSVVVEDSSILEELYGENGARSGTIENATLLKDISEGSGGSNPNNLFAHTDGNLYFSAGGKCWSSDGTEEGTVLFYDSHCTYFGSLGDTLFFATDSEDYGWELHSYDGSSEPVIVKDIWDEENGQGEQMNGIDPNNNINTPSLWPVSVNDEFLLFTARNESNNNELWRTDGTEDGTYMVKDINTDGDGYPSHFFSLDEDRVLFRAQPNAGNNRQLWITDGTEVGTYRLKDINPGDDALIDWFTKHNDQVYFMAKTGDYSDSPRELWTTDGTQAGTYAITNPADFDLLYPAVPVGDILIFKADGLGSYGEELYKYNPATEEISLVIDMEPGSDDSNVILRFVLGNDLFFTNWNDTTYDYAMWKTDGTEEGTSKFFDQDSFDYNIGGLVHRVPTSRDQLQFESYLPTFDNIGLFKAQRESGGGLEAWVTDGTIDGTYQLTDINPDGNALPHDGKIAGGNLFFSATDSEHGEELRIIRNFTDFTPYKPSYTVYTNDEMEPITFNYDESLFQGSIENPTWTTATLGSISFTSDSHHIADIDGDGDMDVV